MIVREVVVRRLVVLDQYVVVRWGFVGINVGAGRDCEPSQAEALPSAPIRSSHAAEDQAYITFLGCVKL
jgi:hypothetical protein